MVRAGLGEKARSVARGFGVMVRSVWKKLGDITRSVLRGLWVMATSVFSGLGEMARSMWREDVPEHCVVKERGDWVRMMDTSLSQLVEGGEKEHGSCFLAFTTGDLLPSSLLWPQLVEICLFLFIPSVGLSGEAAQEH